MVRRQLDERQWAKIEAVLAAERRAGRPPKDNRNFVEAVLWWRRTGVPWRDLPGDFGPWKTVFNRFEVVEGRQVEPTVPCAADRSR